MTDRISNEELESATENLGDYSQFLAEKSIFRIAHSALLELRARRERERWIPVAERLPDEYEHVIFWVNGSTYLGHRMTVGWLCEDTGAEWDQVDYWRQPLEWPEGA